MTQDERRRCLLQALLQERPEYQDLAVPKDAEGQRQLLRGLLNVREAAPCSAEFLHIQDEYLQAETAAKGITDAADLRPVRDGLCLWQGDITTLKCDAIVNAANSGMTGCYVPNHRCIDNCIHTFAGVQLRRDCAELMRQQGRPEQTGGARLTKAYNLPCRYILHTVGPIVAGRVTRENRKALANCYRSCMTLAALHGLKSVAFCCISTGEFHFPHDEAAAIAVETVTACQQQGLGVEKVIFNVFKDTDREIYEQLL